MRQLQKDALRVIRDARALATRTSDSRLHRACGRAIEVMVEEGGLVPSDLRIYAWQVRKFDGDPVNFSASMAEGNLVG